MLQRVVAGHNKSPHRKIFGETPADVSKPPETEHQRSVIFDLRYQGAKDVRFNQDRIDKRREKLKAARGFRVLIKTKRLNCRPASTRPFWCRPLQPAGPIAAWRSQQRSVCCWGLFCGNRCVG
jgi:hypothetical protein